MYRIMGCNHSLEHEGYKGSLLVVAQKKHFAVSRPVMITVRHSLVRAVVEWLV
jgi:hypothetical protein